MDVCLRGDEPTRLRLRGVTVVLGMVSMPLAFGIAEGQDHAAPTTRKQGSPGGTQPSVTPYKRSAVRGNSPAGSAARRVASAETPSHDTPKTGMVMPWRRHPLRGFDAPKY